MVTKEQIESAPDDQRPSKISITYADGHTVDFHDEAARAMHRWWINGRELEEVTN